MVRPRSFWEQRLRLRKQRGAGARRSLAQLAAPGVSGARPGSEYFKGSLDEAGVQVG